MDLVTVDKLLTTTRAVRRRLDLNRPVEKEVIQECLEIAIQAPSAGNTQSWYFMVVTEADKRARIGELYRESFYSYVRSQEGPLIQYEIPKKPKGDQMRLALSGVYLAVNMARVPLMVIPCIHGRVEDKGVMAQASLYGSILPATWSFMLALRARGLGSAWTTAHLRYESEIATILGIPDDFTQAALLPIAYFTGEDFKPAKRVPAVEVTSWDSWGNKVE